MCRRFAVELTPADEKDAKRWTGVFVPVYAAVALLLLGALVVPQLMPPGDPVAIAGRAASAR